jgi:hypothetical protein
MLEKPGKIDARLPPPDVLQVSEHSIKSDTIQTSVADIRNTAFVVSSMNIIIE